MDEKIIGNYFIVGAFASFIFYNAFADLGNKYCCTKKNETIPKEEDNEDNPPSYKDSVAIQIA